MQNLSFWTSTCKSEKRPWLRCGRPISRERQRAMAPKRAPDLYNSGELLQPRVIRLFRSGKRFFVEDHEPGYERIKAEVKAEYTRSDILEKVAMPDAVADAVVDTLRRLGEFAP